MKPILTVLAFTAFLLNAPLFVPALNPGSAAHAASWVDREKQQNEALIESEKRAAMNRAETTKRLENIRAEREKRLINLNAERQLDLARNNPWQQHLIARRRDLAIKQVERQQQRIELAANTGQNATMARLESRQKAMETRMAFLEERHRLAANR